MASTFNTKDHTSSPDSRATNPSSVHSESSDDPRSTPSATIQEHTHFTPFHYLMDGLRVTDHERDMMQSLLSPKDSLILSANVIPEEQLGVHIKTDRVVPEYPEQSLTGKMLPFDAQVNRPSDYEYAFFSSLSTKSTRMAQPHEVGLETNFKAKVPENYSTRFIAIESESAKRSPMGGHPCQGQYFTKEGNPNPEVAIFVVHYSADFSEHYLGPHLAAQGYGFLGFNTRFRGAEDRFILEHALDDIAAGAAWLRNEAKAKKIVFIGNSGGGSLLAAYQAKAQQNPTWVSADAFIFLNAHPGRPDVLTKWLDPSVVDETDPVKTDSSLDMYDPRNKPPYSKEFITRYRAAQVERNNRITRWAKEELKRLNTAGIPDRLFPLYRTMADLRFLDAKIDPSDRPAPACYAGDPRKANRGISLLGRSNTLQTWLSMWSLEESKCKLEPYAAAFSLPTLVVQSTGDTGVYPSDARHVYDIIATKDKELELIPGGHFFDESQKSLDGIIQVIGDWVKRKL
ncbi:hypothetical protein LTR93_011692 [Exophiala xenobiotica]|nr:hypothetical protein LTR93_011692 [Exophiala xenobiotica]